jgi:hypothetical protein
MLIPHYFDASNGMEGMYWVSTLIRRVLAVTAFIWLETKSYEVLHPWVQ